MFLKFNQFSGPKRFVFPDPDKPKKLYVGKSYEELYRLIRGYRSQNELPEIPFLETVVENYLCRLPEHAGSCRPRGPLKRGLIPAIKGGIALIQTMLYSSFASQEVADARSEICVTCPLNSFPDKDKFVKWSDDIAEQSVGSRRSKHHDELGNCLGCGCPLRPKVFYNGKIELTKKQKAEMSEAKPECWQVKESK